MYIIMLMHLRDSSIIKLKIYNITPELTATSIMARKTIGGQ
jgi:hypothetical protein